MQQGEELRINWQLPSAVPRTMGAASADCQAAQPEAGAAAGRLWQLGRSPQGVARAGVI